MKDAHFRNYPGWKWSSLKNSRTKGSNNNEDIDNIEEEINKEVESGLKMLCVNEPGNIIYIFV